MTSKTIQLHLGLLACGLALFLVFVAIPFWVSSPSNVPQIVLSPLFWPYTIAGMSAAIGILLLVEFKRMPEGEVAETDPNQKEALIRLGGMAVIMACTMFLLPTLGMVWTCMLAFLASAFLVKTRHPIAAIVCAIVIPLVLYVFFVHVAGVAIPQGDFVRLP
ncbi:MAG: tripartite tricarboxylate transporter TctB family protein [Hyphomicrobiales bacterium]